jgi:hypothetical protein
MNNEFDVKEFAKMFDAALASDNPGVKKALQNFMMIAAIVYSQEEDESIRGPFSEIFHRLDKIEREMFSIKKETTPYPVDYYRKIYGNQTWNYNNPFVTSVTSGADSTSATGGEASTSNKRAFGGYTTISVTDIQDILKDVNIK